MESMPCYLWKGQAGDKAVFQFQAIIFFPSNGSYEFDTQYDLRPPKRLPDREDYFMGQKSW